MQQLVGAVIAMEESLLRHGEALAAVGFFFGAITTIASLQRFKPSKEDLRSPNRRIAGRAMTSSAAWKTGRFYRIPLLLLGAVGLVMMLIAVA